MRALLLTLAACGGSSCPTAAQVGGDPAEAKIVVERCRADGWSSEVTDCLKAAKTDQDAQEPCFRKLEKPQKARLKTAFAPLYERNEREEKAGAIALLAEDIAALHLDELIARAPSCAEYRQALDAARNALAKCDAATSSLATYATVQTARRDVAALRALSDAQLGAECTARAKAFPQPSCR